MTKRFGIIGLGEAGFAIASGLVGTGAASVCGYDVRADDAMTNRARAAGVDVVDNMHDLLSRSDLVICLTSAKSALAVAETIAPLLRPGQLYSDWNSASPQLKRAIADVIAPTGALFIDGAVMSAVPPQKHRVPVLVSGDGADAFVQAVAGLEMRIESLGGEAGQASAVKMFRSLLVKGLEALLIECVAGADRYGVTELVLTSMNGTLPTADWNELANYLVMRSVEHGARRAEELRQVAETLNEASVEPLLAAAGARRLQWFADFDLGSDQQISDYASAFRAIGRATDHA